MDSSDKPEASSPPENEASTPEADVSAPDVSESTDRENIHVIYKLRDRNSKMVAAWTQIFASQDHVAGRVEVTQGDIFKEAPAADALVSPANSFGFMDGGIDGAYSMHFGWQMQERLQQKIRRECDGELLVGQAIIIPCMDKDVKEEDIPDHWKGCNEDKPIRWLISAPTMRVPQEVDNTVNAFLAFKAVILAVKRHNEDPNTVPIRSVLCPGLGTAVGKMPPKRCAYQMRKAFEIFDLGRVQNQVEPDHLEDMWLTHYDMMEFGPADPLPPPPKAGTQKKTPGSLGGRPSKH